MEVVFKGAYWLDVVDGDVSFTTLAGYVRMRSVVTPGGKAAVQVAACMPDDALCARASVFVVEEDSPERLVLRRVFSEKQKQSRWTLRPITVEEWRSRGKTEYPAEVMAPAFLQWQTLEDLCPFEIPDPNDFMMAPSALTNPSLFQE